MAKNSKTTVEPIVVATVSDTKNEGTTMNENIVKIDLNALLGRIAGTVEYVQSEIAKTESEAIEYAEGLDNAIAKLVELDEAARLATIYYRADLVEQIEQVKTALLTDIETAKTRPEWRIAETIITKRKAEAEKERKAREAREIASKNATSDFKGLWNTQFKLRDGKEVDFITYLHIISPTKRRLPASVKGTDEKKKEFEYLNGKERGEKIKESIAKMCKERNIDIALVPARHVNDAVSAVFKLRENFRKQNSKKNQTPGVPKGERAEKYGVTEVNDDDELLAAMTAGTRDKKYVEK